MMEQRIITPEQQKFVAKLMGFEFDIVYRPGRQNHVADALSRRREAPELTAVTGPIWKIWEDIREASATHPEIIEKRQLIEEQHVDATDYEWRNGILFFQGKVYVPKIDALRLELIHHFHDSRFGGHSGIYRTWTRMASTFTWAGMKQDVRQYVTNCDVCQRVKTDSRK